MSDGLVDLHSHVLPGIDDGPADLDGAVALAAGAAAAGVGVLAATPHVRADHPGVRPEELGGRVEALRAALRDAGVPIEVQAGGEVDLYWATDADDRALRLVSLGQRGHDLLVETPYGTLPPLLEDLLFRLTARGYRLLLAHPERSPGFQRDPRRLAALVERGTLLQVTASALVDRRRRSRTHRFAVQLLREGLAHVIASDAHRPGERASLRAGVEAATRVAPARAAWMACEAPAAILAGEPLPPAPHERRRRLARWLPRS